MYECILSFCDAMNCGPPSSSGFLQVRILEWVANALLQGIFLTRGSNPQVLLLLHYRLFFTTEPPAKPTFIYTHMQIIAASQSTSI